MIQKIYIATGNAHKLEEISAILQKHQISVFGLKEFADYEAPEETGQTFFENAKIKAEALYLYLKSKKLWDDSCCVLADDSGLQCEDLEGAPGVRSARYAGLDATDAQNNAKLMQEFAIRSHHTRAARFVCSLCLIESDGTQNSFEGTCEGIILMSPKGDHGFGYDPHFYLEQFDKTMAELTLEEKNRVSHRARALALLSDFLGM